ncbi:hypothetical protein BX666DRAFT_1970712 [Dichotomocladium elegans]|nr:hypothetical protein BX666DRAFT_1970712 [Dichotomocladium elegans]
MGGALSHRLGNSFKKTEVNPSQIVITKSVKQAEPEENTKPSPQPSIRQDKQSYMTASKPLSPPASSAQKPSLSIRGLSGHSGGLSIRGEGSPARVLISNLDPGANTEDVKAACSAFGTVLHCEVLTDPSGQSYGEAEVDFSTKQAALECIEKLDNEIADGRVIRAILRNVPRVQHHQPVVAQHHPPPLHNFATQTLRSVIAPTRTAYTTTTLPPAQPSTSTGKLYSDQLVAPEQQLGYPDYPPPPPPQSRWYS